MNETKLHEDAGAFLRKKNITFEGEDETTQMGYTEKLTQLLVDFVRDIQSNRQIEPADNVFHFGQYTLRPATEADRAITEEWIDRDPFHKGLLDGKFFTQDEAGVGTYVVEDADGRIFFLRTENAIRLQMQFSPSETQEQRDRIRDALIDGFSWISMELAKRGVTEILYRSKNPMLIRITEKRLGFQRSPQEMVRGLSAERAFVEQENKRRNAQHITQDEV